MNRPVSHQAIAASAGSGKTYQLAHRYVRLLGLGVPADRVAALTFSRKAAGEIFDAVVVLLLDAATTDEAATATAGRIELTALDRASFRDMLREFLRNLNRTHIGTLDSFIISIVRAFPNELGVSPDFTVTDADSPAGKDATMAVLQQIFAPRRVDAEARAAFMEAFRLATFGHESKAAARDLARFVESYRETYALLPDREAWGDPATIWGDPARLETAERGGPGAAEVLLTRLAAAELPDGTMARWRGFLEKTRDFSASSAFDDEIQYLFKKLATARDSLSDGVEITVDRKKMTLDPEDGRLALACLRHLVAVMVGQSVITTGGIYRLLDLFNDRYDAWSRRAGVLTFGDAQTLLARPGASPDAPRISRSPAGEHRLYVDYRLDCELDHWLLDEFQDTSDVQWEVLANLADEILSDNSGRRSWFYVGDVKQSIYGWRGGNPRLFHRILERYDSAIEPRSMAISYRSGASVIDTVNSVFASLPDAAFPPATQHRWNQAWAPHQCRVDRPPPPGFTTLVEPPYDGANKPTDEDIDDVVAGIVRQIDPVARGLSIAVLVRSNKAGHRVVDSLRSRCPDIPVVHEGQAPIRDSPVVECLIQLLQMATHPGDSAAWTYLQMSPLRDTLNAIPSSRHQWPIRILDRVHAVGMEGVVREWSDTLATAVTLDPFSRLRLGDVARAAAVFDATHSRDVDAFLRTLASYATSELAAERAVRVMTVHQSKGLGFDAVILPELGGRAMTTAGQEKLHVHRDTQADRPAWVLRMPLRAIAEQDPVLNDALEQEQADAAFDSLCVLYVAMTRPRHALYMVSAYPGKSSKALTAAAFAKQQLIGETNPVDGTPRTYGGVATAELYSRGNPDWYADWETQPPAPAEPEPSPIRKTVDTTRPVPVEPSAHDAVARSAALLFRAEKRDVLDFGTAVHELFEGVSWIEDADVEAILAAFADTHGASEVVIRDASSQFRSAMDAPAVRKRLARPPGPVELWRERRFELLLDGNRWVRGAFDRVEIHLDQSGEPRGAAIIDYKSDRVEGEAGMRRLAEGYAEQLSLYREALAQILGIEDAAITRHLVFTRVGKVVDL